MSDDYANELMRRWEMADPRDRWRHTGQRPPDDKFRNSGLEQDYRLVTTDGVASAAELQRLQDKWMRERNHGAPEVTVDALMFSLRSRGVTALSEPDTKRRLSELNKDQIAEVVVRLHRLRAKYPAVTDELIKTIGRGL
jgi:hypothetical protein